MSGFLSILPYLVAGWIFFVGLFGIVRSRNLIHAVVCVSIAQSGTYLTLLSVGFRRGGHLRPGTAAIAEAADIAARAPRQPQPCGGAKADREASPAQHRL